MVKRLSLLLAAFMVLGSTLALGFTPPVSALSGADWRAGRIIDDEIFTAKNSMSVADIQAFLNAKVGTGGYASIPGQCDTNGVRSAQPYSSMSRAEYARSLGRSDKFTCLSGYYEVPKTAPGPDVPASNYGGAPIPPGAQSAAQLIWNAAQRYNINPKVLLVTIEKESAGPLTRDDWPFQKQYKWAMGAHCPDNPPPEWPEGCDPDYSGFSLQIDESAALFRWYLDNMDQPWWSYKKPGNNNILYNPNTSCGSSNVYIENKATAALYTYTPYQPNQAALNNLYGSGDGCSAYGNRNFWRIYSDWFGNPAAPPITVTESPTSVSWANGRIDVFARGSDGGLWQKWYDVNTGGIWQPWAHLSNATIHSAPTVSTMGPGRLDIFTKGAGGDLMHYWYAAGAWQTWESLGQPSSSVYLTSSPAAVSWANGRIDVFARGSDGGLWQKWYDVNHGGWNSWARIGTGLTSAPSVSSWKSERLDVFARGPNSEVLHYWFMKPQGWGSESIGGNVISNPASASWAEGRLDVFVQGRDGYMYQNWYDASQGGGWRGWHKFGFGLSSNPSVSSWGPGRLDLFTKGTSSDLQHFWFTNLSWSSHWESLGQPY